MQNSNQPTAREIAAELRRLLPTLNGEHMRLYRLLKQISPALPDLIEAADEAVRYMDAGDDPIRADLRAALAEVEALGRRG